MDWVSELEACMPEGLYVHNLRRIVLACDRGMKEDGPVLPAYVMRSVVADLLRHWEGEAVLVDEARRVESLLLGPLQAVVRALREGAREPALTGHLEHLVRAWLSV